MRIVLILFGVLFFGIVLRLIYVQWFQYEELTEKAKENWDRIIPFVAERGLILDKNGEVLVSNVLAPTLYFMPAQNDDVEQVAEQLSERLHVEKDALLKRLQQNAFLIRIGAGKNISAELAEEIAQLNIDGLYVVLDYKRQYPYGTLLARLLGFTGADYVGLSGLEFGYDEVLKKRHSEGHESAGRRYDRFAERSGRRTPGITENR